MHRRDAREIIMKILFEIDLQEIEPDTVVERTFVERPGLSFSLKEFISDIIYKTTVNMKEIDDLIRKYAVGWSLERMGVVDRNILRLAVAELLYCDSIPTGVSINEAIEIAKKYGDQDSPKFINGVLGSVSRSILTEVD